MKGDIGPQWDYVVVASYDPDNNLEEISFQESGNSEEDDKRRNHGWKV